MQGALNKQPRVSRPWPSTTDATTLQPITDFTQSFGKLGPDTTCFLQEWSSNCQYSHTRLELPVQLLNKSSCHHSPPPPQPAAAC